MCPVFLELLVIPAAVPIKKFELSWQFFVVHFIFSTIAPRMLMREMWSKISFMRLGKSKESGDHKKTQEFLTYFRPKKICHRHQKCANVSNFLIIFFWYKCVEKITFFKQVVRSSKFSSHGNIDFLLYFVNICHHCVNFMIYNKTSFLG